MRKSPAVAYCLAKIKTVSKADLKAQLDNSPLTEREACFVADVARGMNNMELADKYNISPSRVASWKREVFETLFKFDRQKATR